MKNGILHLNKVTYVSNTNNRIDVWVPVTITNDKLCENLIVDRAALLSDPTVMYPDKQITWYEAKTNLMLRNSLEKHFAEKGWCYNKIDVKLSKRTGSKKEDHNAYIAEISIYYDLYRNDYPRVMEQVYDYFSKNVCQECEEGG